ncbi:serine/threonine protein phosphatase PrpC [Marmoricola sp. OAE513]|uniref:PP2C family protein-serine/threonine phosphatase n=1 Tax=Marmoricola sp. OAE513 TaxID=2817894 RepID=UPI001AE71A7D
MLRLSGTGDSHVGLVRGNNEDSAFVSPYCILVADGVGGGAAGEVASATAAYALAGTALMRRGEDPAQVLAAGFALAQAQVHAGVDLDPSRSGMATTLTSVVTDGTRFVLGHLGDSRGYVFRDGELNRVSTDHTYIQNMLDEGRLDEAGSAEHPWRNVVLRVVNGHADVEPDLVELDLVVGDRVLLASDGLSDLVTEDEIARTLGAASDDAAVPELIARALGRGGRDNVTCVLATVVDGPEISADGHLYGALGDPGNVVDVAAVRAPESA